MPAAADYTIIWKPQEGPQTSLIKCPIFEVFYGGARGGGKTESSIGDWLDHSQRYGENAIGIFVRRKLTQLAEVIARTRQLFPKLGAKYNKQDKTWTMANGARLKFVYLERDEDAEEYQGHSYTRVYVEELTNFPSPDPINKLRATLRSAAGVPVGMRLTGNPGGPGHNWVKARYIDYNPRGFEVKYDTEIMEIDGQRVEARLGRVFIPSKLGDNALLLKNDPTYIIRLRQSGSAALVKAWLEGDWSLVDGAYFDEFTPDQHVLSYDHFIRRIPPRATWFRAMDWGSAKPFSVGWYVVSDGTWGLPSGAIVRAYEWYGAKGPNIGVKMTARAVAEGIVARERQYGLRPDYGVADPAIFIQNGGESIFEMMNSAGVQWRPADNKRVPGWQACRQALAWNHKNTLGEVEVTFPPKFYVLDNCTDFIRTVPVLQHDDKNQEDLDTDGEDHVADEWRYALMSRPQIKDSRQDNPFSLPKLPSELTFFEWVERQKRLAQARAED